MLASVMRSIYAVVFCFLDASAVMLFSTPSISLPMSPARSQELAAAEALLIANDRTVEQMTEEEIRRYRAADAMMQHAVDAVDAAPPRMPNVLFMGMGHSGSTSLTTQLVLHSQLSAGCIKERSFWFQQGGFRHIVPRKCEFGNMQDYMNSFCRRSPGIKLIDADPQTIFLGNPNAATGRFPQFLANVSPGEDAVKMVKSILGPDLKIVAMFRKPEELLGSFLSELAAGRTVDSIYPFLWALCYADHLDGWLKVFPRQNFLFLKTEDYFKDNQATLNKVLKFLNVHPKHYTEAELHPHGRRRSHNSIQANAWRDLNKHIDTERCQQRLASITGLQLNDWDEAAK